MRVSSIARKECPSSDRAQALSVREDAYDKSMLSAINIVSLGETS